MSVRITSLVVPPCLPSSLTNNQSRAVTLDVGYTYTHDERDSLVVEWFYNNQNAPFYRLAAQYKRRKIYFIIMSPF